MTALDPEPLSLGGWSDPMSRPLSPTSPAVIAKRRVALDGACGTGSLKKSASEGCLDSTLVGIGLGRQRTKFHPVDSSYYSPFEVSYTRVAKERNLRKLARIFYEADTDRSRTLSEKEFQECLREPGMQRIFSRLGVQPHQSELVFSAMSSGRKGAELSIEEFIRGLTGLVGADADGSGLEIHVGMLRPTRKAKEQRMQMASSWRLDAGLASSVSESTKKQSSSKHYLGQIDRLPVEAVHRAFLASASAHALHPATATQKHH